MNACNEQARWRICSVHTISGLISSVTSSRRPREGSRATLSPFLRNRLGLGGCRVFRHQLRGGRRRGSRTHWGRAGGPGGLVHELALRLPDGLEQVAGQGSRDDRDGDGDDESDELRAGLALCLARSVQLAVVVDQQEDEGDDRAEDGRQAVEVVDAAAVVQALLLQRRLELDEPDRRDETGKAADSESPGRAEQEVGGSADRDTASQRCVLDVCASARG